MSFCGTGLFPTPDPINPDLNASALTATTAFAGVHLKWTFPDSAIAGVSHTQIYRGLVNDFSLALELTRVKGDYYYDPMDDISQTTTYFYWIRNFDNSGRSGNVIGPASVTLEAPVGDIITALSGQIDQSYLATSLSNAIDNITTIEGSLAQEILDRTDAENLLTTALDTASSDFDDVRTALITETNERITADSAQIDSINALGVRVGATESSIINIDTVTAGGYCEIGGSPNVAYTDKTACEGAGGTWKSMAALAASVEALDSGIPGRITASITSTDYTEYVGHCEIGGVPNSNYNSATACSQAGGTWVTTTARAASVDNYIVNNNQSVGALEQTVSVHSDDLGDLKAEYFMKTSVSTDPLGQPLVGGFGVVNDGITVDAGFDVDNFWVGRSDANKIKPFYVSGGDVYMQSAFIQNLSADKLTSGTISSRTYITNSTGQRLEIQAPTNSMSFYDLTNTERVRIDDATNTIGYLDIKGLSNKKGISVIGCAAGVTADGSMVAVSGRTLGADNGIGVYGLAIGVHSGTRGVEAYTEGNGGSYAVYARHVNNDPGGAAVYAKADDSTPALRAISQAGDAVIANTTTGKAGDFRNNSSNMTIYVENSGSGSAVHADSANSYGVIAYSNAAGKAAVYGVTTDAVGVAGSAGGGRAIQGIATGNGYGVWGECTSSTGPAYAGYFKSKNSANSRGLFGEGVAYGVGGTGNIGGWFQGGPVGVSAEGGNYGAHLVGGIADAYLGGTGTLASFTGAHESLYPKTNPVPELGDIVVRTAVAYKESVSSTIHYVELCSSAEDVKAFGVVSNILELPEYDSEDTRPIKVASLYSLTESEYNAVKASYKNAIANGIGEGQINVCSANGNIVDGGFISTSTIPGKGQFYGGNDMRVVVAQACEDVDWSQESESTKMIACIYMCS
jgi:hypothetical protein